MDHIFFEVAPASAFRDQESTDDEEKLYAQKTAIITNEGDAESGTALVWCATTPITAMARSASMLTKCVSLLFVIACMNPCISISEIFHI
ncbi:hypothetical protein [Comamonas sp. B-9]|uniref:hypothetical protein n=1 Tax=Comamonas sp. B-9 TaxID=1055192 RepID=UPI001EFA0290|nr:hypothetical protein [Comamonas sp. B-9]